MTDQFQTFWTAYPRRKGKGAARAAFLKALKLATFDEIMEGVEKLKAEIKCKGTDSHFIPHASTWLNQERWDDEYETPDLLEERRKRNIEMYEQAKRRWGMA